MKDKLCQRKFLSTILIFRPFWPKHVLIFCNIFLCYLNTNRYLFSLSQFIAYSRQQPILVGISFILFVIIFFGGGCWSFFVIIFLYTFFSYQKFIFVNILRVILERKVHFWENTNSLFSSIFVWFFYRFGARVNFPTLSR